MTAIAQLGSKVKVPEEGLDFFPLPTRFVRERRLVEGWLHGYHSEPSSGLYGKETLFACVSEQPDGHIYTIPVTQLIDD